MPLLPRIEMGDQLDKLYNAAHVLKAEYTCMQAGIFCGAAGTAAGEAAAAGEATVAATMAVVALLLHLALLPLLVVRACS